MEIERKWMVTGWPEGLPLEEEFTMRQGYISVQPTVRIREEALTGGSTDYILCFKSAGGLAREEIERSIDKDLFVQLEEKIIGKPLIKKVRRSYRLPDGAVLAQRHNDVIPSKEQMGNVVTENKTIPDCAMNDMVLGNICLKYTQSNSVGYALNGQMIGVGAGQQSRIDCVKLAVGSESGSDA